MPIKMERMSTPNFDFDKEEAYQLLRQLVAIRSYPGEEAEAQRACAAWLAQNNIASHLQITQNGQPNVIARIENAPLGDVLERRIFKPLGMKDTGFTVPKAKQHRRHAHQQAGQCVRPTTRERRRDRLGQSTNVLGLCQRVRSKWGNGWRHRRRQSARPLRTENN